MLGLNGCLRSLKEELFEALVPEAFDHSKV
jgi:hypothetical protein